MNNNKNDLTIERLWLNFQKKNALSEKQLEQFQQYANLLIKWNKKFNITAVDDIAGIISTHFQDSIALAKVPLFSKAKSLADVGSGGGFPGIPIKIMRPDLFVVLIEVNQKKVQFLNEVIVALGLSEVETCDLDWRSFLRNTNYKIDFFSARASLPVKELLRVFKPNCLYQDSFVVYWASRHYELKENKERVCHIESYSVARCNRKLVFFKK